MPTRQRPRGLGAEGSSCGKALRASMTFVLTSCVFWRMPADSPM
jgi:hypothetical protein